MYLGVPVPWQCCELVGGNLSKTPGQLSFHMGSLLSRAKEKVNFFLFVLKILLQWKSCAAFFATLRQGWAGLRAWTWRQRILHLMEGLWCTPRNSALLYRLPAKPEPSAAQLECQPRTKWACLALACSFFFPSCWIHPPPALNTGTA